MVSVPNSVFPNSGFGHFTFDITKMCGSRRSNGAWNLQYESLEFQNSATASSLLVSPVSLDNCEQGTVRSSGYPSTDAS
eukprot:933472-Prorocentrum_minimum.AAC.1